MMEGYQVKRSKTIMKGISSAGYDAQCAVLELEFQEDGQIWQFYNVPEQVWYGLRRTESTLRYYHMNILGKYEAQRM